MKIGIVGLGLIGGSMAKSIKSRTGHTVYGIDLDQETMLLARLCGAIDGPLDEDTLPVCDLVLLAVRPQAAVDWVRDHGAQIGAAVVDLCGVKRTVVEQITPLARQHGFIYVGGHPMAGRERGGFTSSTEDLYVGASMILTPDETVDETFLDTLRTFFLDVGFAKLTLSQPEEHDRIIAFTSQLAHVVSNAYIKSPEADRHNGYSAGSYKDLTRGARLNEVMWAELFLCNQGPLLDEIDTIIENLQKVREAIAEGDAGQLKALLKEGSDRKRAIDLFAE